MKRVERLEALEAIRRLAFKYAKAVDDRDFDSLVACFVPDVSVGIAGTGHEALRAWYKQALDGLKGTGHLVANQLINITGQDTASAVVYCRAEHELDLRHVTLFVEYSDELECRAGEWLYRRRRARYWYSQEIPIEPRETRQVLVPATGELRRPGLPRWWPPSLA